MSKIDVENHLSGNEEKDEAEIDPSDNSDGIIAVTVTGIRVDVAIGNDIKLLSWGIGMSSSKDGKQDGPSHEAANEGDYDGHLEIPEEEKAIERVLL